MPYRAGAIGIPWHNCSRCGIMTRVSELIYQNGLFVCTTRDCFDNPSGFNRYERIARVLSDGKTEPQHWLEYRPLNDGVNGDRGT